MNMYRWQNACIVGFGAHARTKLSPAILMNGQSLNGIVTRMDPECGNLPDGIATFKTVEDAMSKLPTDTLFIIATPPVSHFSQLMPLLNSGRDVLVEKPAFVSVDEARHATGAARESGAVLVEGFMNRHTLTHRRFLADRLIDSLCRLDFVFTIPSAPTGTFRSDSAIGSSNLYDMGCYFLATISDIGLTLDQIVIERVENAGEPDRELVHLAGNLDGIAVTAKIGVDDTYVNCLKLRTPSSTFSYTPFIYGRPGSRLVERVEGNHTQSEQIDDVNAFAEMLAVPRTKWLEDQDFRFAQIIDITKNLERLGITLERMRSGN